MGLVGAYIEGISRVPRLSYSLKKKEEVAIAFNPRSLVLFT